jgi:tetratricopeptide (TPR) repeat protein
MTHAWALAELGIAVARDGADARGAFLLDRAIASFLALGDRPAAAATRLKAAQVALDMGRLEACEAQTGRAIELLDAEDTQLRSRALAFEAAILVRRGQRDVACDWARLAVANLDSTPLAADGEATVRLVYAEVLHAAGRKDDARRAVKSARDRLLEDAGRIMNLELAHTFLADVPEHARTLELADRWSTQQP